MAISGIGGGTLHNLASRPAARKVSAGKDADGDRDGTAPGKVDVRDVLASRPAASGPPAKVNVEAPPPPPVPVVSPQPSRIDVRA
jgi:hypothetical protein